MYSAVTTAPTCIEKGYTTYTCACGESYVDDYADTTGHAMSEWYTVTTPTCTASGMERRDCTNCDHFETRATDSFGHDTVTYDAQAPTCVAIGWNAYETCARCDYTTYTENIIFATGHKTGEWYTVTAPTCTKTGAERRDCVNCDYSEGKDIEVLGHNLLFHNEKAATCLETGWNAYETCSRCDYTTYAELPELGHNYIYGKCTACGDIEFLYGDVNGDGVIDGRDVTRLLDFMCWRKTPNDISALLIAKGADANGDGRIDGRDVTRLNRYLAFLDPATGESAVMLSPQR